MMVVVPGKRRLDGGGGCIGGEMTCTRSGPDCI